MGDFTQTNIAKSAVRELAVPIADITTFNTLVQDILTDNPFTCTAYEVSGVPQPPVAKSREAYPAWILYEDNEARTVGYVTARAGTIAGFAAARIAILADTDLATAIGGDAINSADDERYSVTLKCHDANGEIYLWPSPGARSPSRPTRTTRSSPGSRPGLTRSPPLPDPPAEQHNGREGHG